MCSPIEDLRYTLETLLACSVPNLQLEYLLLELDEEGSEFDANCDFVISHELVVGQSVQQARFADGRVTNDDQLEQEVLVLHTFTLQNLIRHLAQLIHELLWVFITSTLHSLPAIHIYFNLFVSK